MSRVRRLGVSFSKAASPPLRGSLSNDEKILKGKGALALSNAEWDRSDVEGVSLPWHVVRHGRLTAAARLLTE